MGYSHITDLTLSPFNINTKPNISASPCPDLNNHLALNHGDFASSNANERRGDHKQATEFSSSEPQPLALGSSRWNPTPEQLLALEELYRRGTRTPSAAQIQQIAMRLQRFGKIEGKNVFYWFQNHKARERQKRRRQRPQQHCESTDQSLGNKEAAGSVSEIQLAKNEGPSPNFSESSEQFISSTHGIAAAAAAANEWMQIQEELQLIKSRVGKANTYSLDEDENREEKTLELFPLRSSDVGINYNSKKDTTKVPITAINTPNYHYFDFLPLNNGADELA